MQSIKQVAIHPNDAIACNPVQVDNTALTVQHDIHFGSMPADGLRYTNCRTQGGAVHIHGANALNETLAKTRGQRANQIDIYDVICCFNPETVSLWWTSNGDMCQPAVDCTDLRYWHLAPSHCQLEVAKMSQ